MPVLRRMVASRLYLAEEVLGRRALARRALERLHETPRTDVLYLETWNDLFLGLGRLAAGGDARGLFDGCLEVFARLGVAHGERLARLGLLAGALAAGDLPRARELMQRIEASGEASHRFLQAAEPVAVAHARFALGELEAAGERLAVASGAIVGSPFVEVDWQLELLRAKAAMRGRDLTEARRHLHRALHCRSLLVELVPARARSSFLAHPRFGALRELEARLGLGAARHPSTESLRRSRGLDEMVGQSAPMLALYQAIERLRDQELPVLITGETGTGKELVARAIHGRSPRRDRPLRVIQCACLPPELFESELFGHVAGAFTGAERDQAGLLEDASGGTVLLDDVHMLPLASQAKLLGVVESKAIRKLGSVTPSPVDVRFLATASMDLRAAASEGRFLEALYFRLAGVELRVPPLRERRGDVRLLARRLLERHALRLDRAVPALEDDAVSLLERYEWPGNVRELE
ncbi:MAG: sigma-54-dependent Fis family transcriptional regulator, partial [Planctomycetes bacterium]|nr:sigma-54-dependent Fis family transcriptional regulator [Planctomycetota bacterium]